MLFGILLVRTLWPPLTDLLLLTSDPGAVAALAESRKMSKYSALDSTLYRFFPIAIETMGAFGSRSLRFIKNLGRRITLHSGDPLATCHFVQTSLGCHSAG